MELQALTEFARLRHQAGLSLDDLVGILDCSRRTLARYETGEVQPKRPVLESMKSLAAAGNKAPEQPLFQLHRPVRGYRGTAKRV